VQFQIKILHQTINRRFRYQNDNSNFKLRFLSKFNRPTFDLTDCAASDSLHENVLPDD